MSLPAGTRLGPYKILAPIGTGGMGGVYRADDSRLDRQVAFKVLPERALRILEELPDKAKREPIDVLAVALIYVALRDKENAYGG